MKLIIEKSDLLAGLAKVAPVSPSRGTIPILANVAMSAKGDELTLRTSNLDMEAKVTVRASVQTPGDATVNVARLFEIARNVPSGAQITMELGDDPRMKVQSGRSRFMLPVLPIADFPVLEKQKCDSRVWVSAGVLADALSRVVWAQSNSASHYYLVGVNMALQTGSVRLEASNSHVCALTDFEAEVTGDARVIIPSQAVAVIQKLLDGAEDAAEIGISEGRISVAVGTTTLSSKLIDGQFPDIERTIPTDTPITITVDADALVDAVRRVCGASDDKIPAVSLAVSAGSIAITSRGSDGEEAHDEVECDYDGPDMRMTVTTDYVMKCIGALNTDALHIAASANGIRMVWSGDGAGKGLIMGRRG